MQTCCLLSLIKQTNKHIAYENQPDYTDEPWEKVLLYLLRISQKTLYHEKLFLYTKNISSGSNYR